MFPQADASQAHTRPYDFINAMCRIRYKRLTSQLKHQSENPQKLRCCSLLWFLEECQEQFHSEYDVTITGVHAPSLLSIGERCHPRTNENIKSVFREVAESACHELPD
jgi:hypothetical protein